MIERQVIGDPSTVSPIDGWREPYRGAQELTADAQTPYQAAVILENWFQKEFSYDETASYGAVGAFGVLLAFGAAPQPKAAYIPVVMSIIFAGAPIVNAIVSMLYHPPHGGLSEVKWQFWAGIIIAAVGGSMVALFKPDAPAPAKPAAKPGIEQPAKH